MSIKQHGGIFGRNPTFNDVDVEGTLTIDGSLVVNGASMAPIYRGTWDASTNTPTLASGVGTQGDFYIVSAGGSTTLDGVSTWGVGDWVLFNGTTWQRVEGGVDGDFGNILVSGNTISTTNTNGTLEINPDGTGGVGVGGDTVGVVAGNSVSSKFCVKDDQNRPTAGFVHAQNTIPGSGSWVYACRSRGTLDTPAVVQDNDNLATWFVAGHDGTDLALAARISFDVDGTPGNNDMPGRIVVSTTPDGSQIPVEAMRIDSAQKVTFAGDVEITGGDISGITDLAVADGGTGASDASGARTNLGLGTIATQDADSVNIDGGTIDGTPIAGSTGAFTTLTASDDVNFDSGTLFVDASENRVGIGTTSPASDLHLIGTFLQEGAFSLNGAPIYFARYKENLPAGDIDKSFERDFDADAFNLTHIGDGDRNVVKYTAWTRDAGGARNYLYRGSFYCRRSSSGSIDVANFVELESPTISKIGGATMSGISLTVSLVSNRIRFAFSNSTADFIQIRLTTSTGAP